jgi:predicted secreted protein
MALVSKNFSDIITFTRASTATYFDASGTLQSAATDAPRFDYNPSTLAAQGLLIEESRTNALTYSAQFDNAAWTKVNSSVTADAAVSPDGTSNADKLIEDSSVSVFHRTTSILVSSTSGTYTASVFLKAAERSFAFLAVTDNITGAMERRINLATGVVDSTNVSGAGSWTSITASSVNIGNGWWRLTITGTQGAGTVLTTIVSIGDATGARVYTGDGTSGIFLFGAQLEAGAFPTSYIPTTTTALTRAADVASVNMLSPWYNSASGTIYFEGVTFDTLAGAFPRAVQFNDGTNNNVIQITRNNSAGNARMSVVSGGVAQAAADATTWTLSATTKAALAYAANDFAIVANGGAATTDSSGTVPTVSNLLLGSQVGTASFLNGYLRRVSYYPRRLANAELQAITA